MQDRKSIAVVPLRECYKIGSENFIDFLQFYSRRRGRFTEARDLYLKDGNNSTTCPVALN